MCARTNLSGHLGNGFLYKDVFSPARATAFTAGDARVGAPQCLAHRALGDGHSLAAASCRATFINSRFGGGSSHGCAAHILHSFFILSGNPFCSGPAQDSYSLSLFPAAACAFLGPSPLRVWSLARPTQSGPIVSATARFPFVERTGAKPD